MLEPYSDHPLARQKIILVSPGYIAIELQRLGLAEMEWPNVFAHRDPPSELVAKLERENLRLKQRAKLSRSLSTPAAVTGASVSSDALPRLLDMVPSWDVNAVMSKASRGVGFRMAHPSIEPQHLDLAEILESNEELD
jgi:hypothetical protein